MAELPIAASELPSQEHLALRVMPLPADLNPAGDVFGGWIMAMVDIAGGIPAVRRARSRVVTVAVNSFVFKQPIAVGDVVSFYADVISVGRSSLTIDVQVFAETDPKNPRIVKVTEAQLTYVAVDAQGNKRLVPEDADADGLPGCPEPAANKELTLRMVPMPGDLNPAGDVFGGWIMAMTDIAGAVSAMRRARSPVATVAVDRFVFREPVSMGDRVTFYADLVDARDDKLTVDVEVFAQRNPENPVVVKVTEAKITYTTVRAFRSGSKGAPA